MINLLGRSLCQSCFEEIFSEPCPNCGFSEDSYTPGVSVLPCGSVLQGRYAIGRVIGKGGFGITYLAYDIKLDRKVAIKEYFPRELAWRSSDTATVTIHNEKDTDTFKKGAEKFYEEARLVARFNGSSSIVNVFDFFYENSTVYYSMEYLQGQTIKDIVSQSGIMNIDQVKYIAEEVASALVTTHGAKVLHRDVSPDNIMLCSDGKIKLIDFGAARRVISEMSQDFSVILKPGFAPLEQYQKNGKQGPWTDIYSLGTTLYYCLTGKIPEDPMSRIENDDVFSSNLMLIDEGLRNIIRKATAFKIEDRYSSAQEMLKDLKNSSITENISSEKKAANDAENHSKHKKPAAPKKEKPVVTKREKPVVTKSEKIASETQYPKAEPAAEIVPEVNVYGETAAANNKPIIIVSIIGAVVVVFLIFLIVSMTRGGNEDSLSADASVSSHNYETEATKTTTTKDTTVKTTKTTAKTKAETTASKTKTTTTKTTKTTKKTTTTAKKTTKTSTTTTTADTQPTSIEHTTTKIFTTTTTAARPAITNPVTSTTAAVDPNSVKIGKEYYSKNKTGILDLSNQNLTNSDIANLKYMTKISELIISNNKLTDLSAISGLTQLEKLVLDNNDVSNLSFVKNLKKLKHLSAENNGISSISSLSGLTSLEELWLRNNGISNISALSKCSKLKYVGISDNIITDLTPLAGKKLKSLYASNNELNGSYEAITGLKILDYLYLDGNGYDADPDGFYMFTGNLIADDDGFKYLI